MEKIKVNMSPNPLDVQTIHASQNDTEARQWEFELHNNGELIDTSEVAEQLFFKAYKGGTEQILPENGAVPVTAPFVGDIKYPDTTRTDQEFLYRQSPTEKDGNANIKSLYGNTLVWNQLVPPLSAMQGQNGTLSVADNVATITSSSSVSYLGIAASGSSIVLPKGGHKYLLTAEVKSSKAVSNCQLSYGNSIIAREYNISANTWTKLSSILSYSSPTGQYIQFRVFGSFEQGDTMQVRNWNYFDLTAMDLDSITSVEEFTSLFSLPHYSYNQGSLLSFNGNGIKTVGKNQIKLSADTLVSSQRIGINYLDNGVVFTANGTYSRAGYTCKTIKGQQYTLSFKGFSNANFGAVYISNDLDWNTNYGRINLLGTETNNSLTFTANSELFFVGFYLTNTGTSGSMTIKDIQLELGSSATSYVPYTSSTTNLPVSTYFPTGMKSAGNVYDELTESKTITRIGYVDLGTLDWGVSNGTMYANLPDAYLPSTGAIVANAICPKYTTAPLNYVIGKSYDKILALNNGQPRVNIYDSAYTDATAFKTAMSGVYLYYEMATPTETPITTASLVTENAEIPLSNEDGTLIGKCTEELSSQPGFIDAKIKLTDGDGVCYSNKIQLHVERKP